MVVFSIFLSFEFPVNCRNIWGLIRFKVDFGGGHGLENPSELVFISNLISLEYSVWWAVFWDEGWSVGSGVVSQFDPSIVKFPMKLCLMFFKKQPLIIIAYLGPFSLR